MRESKFVDQNQEKWLQFEKELKSKDTNPELLRVQLIEITDDLSYARTFYKNRSVRLYLNGLAQSIHHSIYKNKRNFKKTVVQFFKEDIPRIAYNGRKELLFAFLILILSVLIGAFSSAKDDQFAKSILGNAYVEETIKNIEKGDPMGIYKDQNAFDMFVMIATNNLRVSMFVFLFGLLASYGSLVLLIRNGIMLGVFMYFFYSRNLATEFNLTVWMHGTIEILTLVISALSGMLLGRGLIYPGTFSRFKAFSIWARRGALLFLATTPFILFAAFIESYLTRHTDLPNVLRFAFIMFSAGLMVFYFVIYPYQKFKNASDKDLGMPELRSEQNVFFKTKHIHSNSEILTITISLLKKYFKNIISFILVSGLVLIVIYYFLISKDILDNFKLLNVDFQDLLTFEIIEKLFQSFGNLGILFNSLESPIIYIFGSLWMFAIVLFSLRIIKKELKLTYDLKHFILPMAILCLFMNGLLLIDHFLIIYIYIILYPLLLAAIFQNYTESKIKNLSFFIQINVISGFKKYLGLNVMLFLLSSIGLVFFISPLSLLSIWIVEMNFQLSEITYDILIKFILMFWFALLSGFFIVFQIIQVCLASYTILEIETAEGIKESIQSIGKTKKIFGIESEI
ncbi:MAG: stage II sporulation protein M [Bacteroidota bacterium]|nr:stage II sporulation protein M [Bacteroidota bacterium]